MTESMAHPLQAKLEQLLDPVCPTIGLPHTDVALLLVCPGSIITSFHNLFCEQSLLEIPAIITSFFRTVVFLKGSCLGLRAYAVRLEALRALGSRNLKGWKASGLKVLHTCGPEVDSPSPPPPPQFCLGWSPRHALGPGGGGVYMTSSATLILPSNTQSPKP